MSTGGGEEPETEEGDVQDLHEFRAELDVFSGPLDLLLYLIKRREVDIMDIPVSRITDDYLRALQAMKAFDVNLAAEFTVMAARLMEIKSRSLLPESRSEQQDEEEEEKDRLVHRLLEYKGFKQAASRLRELREHEDRKHHAGYSMADAEPVEDEPQFELEDVQVWDLVSTMGRLIQQTQMSEPEQIVYDEVPVADYMGQVRQRLQRGGGTAQFIDFFRTDRSRPRLVGIFLAVLELIKRGEIEVEQEGGVSIAIRLVEEGDSAGAAEAEA